MNGTHFAVQCLPCSINDYETGKEICYICENIASLVFTKPATRIQLAELSLDGVQKQAFVNTAVDL
jgi:hypothetical protein